MDCEYKGYTINGRLKKVYWLKKQKQYYCKQYICLDTETSHNHDNENPECWIYQWAYTFNKSIYYGRKPSELIASLQNLCKFYQTDEKHHILVFVHNLPYDFSYLALYLRDAFGDPLHILASEPHKPFCVQYENGLEFRCTYKLSNDSLERWGAKLGIKHPKMVGAIDYNKIRLQSDSLYKNDWRYMFRDCIAMDECLHIQMAIYGDDIKTLPLTSTGYPRRTLYRAFNAYGKGGKKNKERQYFKDTKLELDTYMGYRSEFSGGITHGNRYYKCRTLRAKDLGVKIRHRDFRSHYPTQQQKLMPMSKPIKFTDKTTVNFLERFSKQYAIMCHLFINDVRLKRKTITLPYLQTSHVMAKHSRGIRVLDDNGRVIQFSGQCELWLDFNELKLVLSQYDYTALLIVETYASLLAPMPDWMTKTINEHFKKKSDLSNALKLAKDQGASREDILQLSLDLMKSKNMLNGIYGVSATDPVRQEITIDGNMWDMPKLDINTVTDQLDKYYKSLKHCMRYQWGCYTTIYARLQLMDVYNIIGDKNFIYADTDSLFYFSTPEIESKLEEYNRSCYEWAVKNGAYITTDAGKIINYNAFEDEKENIVEFRFLHSKCYAYVTDDGKLHCTIAGVKQYDRETKTFREDELGSIDELRPNKIFTKCGGTTSTYLPNKNKLFPLECTYTSNGQEWAGGCIINRTTKTLTATEWSETEKMYHISFE